MVPNMGEDFEMIDASAREPLASKEVFTPSNVPRKM
jgi:hypothetical protein